MENYMVAFRKIKKYELIQTRLILDEQSILRSIVLRCTVENGQVFQKIVSFVKCSSQNITLI